MTTLYLYMKLTARSRLVIGNISLMLLSTMKIVPCIYRHIIKSLSLPQSLCQNVLTEFEYQLELEFSILLNLL